MCKIGSPLLSFLLCSLCTPLQSLYEEIVYATPNIDKAAARKLHYVMLDYVPNSGSQKLARTGAKYATEGGLIAAGILTRNPLLMKAGASAAMSMIKDLSHSQYLLSWYALHSCFLLV